MPDEDPEEAIATHMERAMNPLDRSMGSVDAQAYTLPLSDKRTMQRPATSFEFEERELAHLRGVTGAVCPEVPRTRLGHGNPTSSFVGNVARSFRVTTGGMAKSFRGNMASSFAHQLSERHGAVWMPEGFQRVDDDKRKSSSNRGFRRYGIKQLPRLLTTLGWLPDNSFSSGLKRHTSFFFMCFLDLCVVASIFIYNGSAASEKGLKVQLMYHFADSILRFGAVLSAHIGMYWIGGSDLAASMCRSDFSVPFGHAKALLVLVALEYAVDIWLVYLCFIAFHIEDGPFSLVFRRLIIMVQRIPVSLALIAMMSFPRQLQQFELSILSAIDSERIDEAQRVYGLFWRHLRIGRRWYNVTMSALFLSAITRLPFALYAYWHYEDVNHRKYDVLNLCLYSGLETLCMIVWVEPAISVRRYHGMILRSAVCASGSGDRRAKASGFANMVGSLHGMVGLKMLDCRVTWRIAPRLYTIVSFILLCLHIILDDTSEN